MTTTYLRDPPATEDSFTLASQISENNTKVITSADASPGSPWIGTADQLIDDGFVGVHLEVISSAAIAGTYTFQFGDDGISWPVSITTPSSDFSTIRFRKLFANHQYFRAQFEPTLALGGTLVFVQCVLLRQPGPDFVVPAGHIFEEEEAAFGQTFAFLKGYDFQGLSRNVRVTPEGFLITNEFLVEVRKGNVPGHSLVLQQGQNPDIDTTSETVWAAASTVATYQPPVATDNMTFAVNVADIGKGLVANIIGLDASGNMQTATLALNAVSVSTSETWSAMQLVRVISAFGITLANDVLITIGAQTVGLIQAGRFRTQVGYYHVPADHEAYLINLHASTSNSGSSGRVTSINARFTDQGVTVFEEVAAFGGHSQGAATNIDFEAPFKFAAGDVIRCDMICTNNNNPAHCSLGFLLIEG